MNMGEIIIERCKKRTGSAGNAHVYCEIVLELTLTDGGVIQETVSQFYGTNTNS
jgi:hypothetical protein